MDLAFTCDPLPAPPSPQARAKLEEMGRALGVDVVRAARLAGKVPATWNRCEPAVWLMEQTAQALQRFVYEAVAHFVP